jgi:hypothetical protein
MLARFERLMEQAVEGSLRRVFPTPLQPVQLAKAAARAMEEGRVVGLRGAEVPNAYEVRIAPADLERFGDYGATLERELAQYLAEYAHERGLRPIGEPTVALLGDSDVRAGRVRTSARFADLAADRRAEVDEALGSTRRLRLAELAAASPEPAPSAPTPRLWLSDGAEIRYALQPDWILVRIGRANDNDLVIPQARVSRYHAQLRRVEATWLVYDLGSTNGTFVNSDRLEPERPRGLPTRGRLRLGDYDLHVSADVLA